MKMPGHIDYDRLQLAAKQEQENEGFKRCLRASFAVNECVVRGETKTMKLPNPSADYRLILQGGEKEKEKEEIRVNRQELRDTGKELKAVQECFKRGGGVVSCLGPESRLLLWHDQELQQCVKFARDLQVLSSDNAFVQCVDQGGSIKGCSVLHPFDAKSALSELGKSGTGGK